MGVLHRKRDRERAARAAVNRWLIDATTIPESNDEVPVEEEAQTRRERPLRAKAAARD